MLDRATPAQKFGFFFLAFIIISVGAYFLLRQNPNIARSDKILAQVGKVDIKESQVKELVALNVGLDSESQALEFMIEDEAVRQLAAKNSVTVTEDEVKTYAKAKYGFQGGEIPEGHLLRETKLAILKQKLGEKVEGYSEGTVYVGNFDKYITTQYTTDQQILSLTQAERDARTASDKSHADSFIRSLRAQVASGALTPEAALARINGDSRLGTVDGSQYNTAPIQSGRFGAEEYVGNDGPFKVDPAVKTAIATLQAGTTSEIVIGRMLGDGDKLIDARFMFFRIDKKVPGDSGKAYGEWYKAESENLPVKRFEGASSLASRLVGAAVASDCSNPSGDTRGGEWGVNNGSSSSGAGLAIRTRTNDGTVLNGISLRVYETSGGNSINYSPFGSYQSSQSSRTVSTGETVYCSSSTHTDSFSGWAIFGWGLASHEGDRYDLNCRDGGSAAVFNINQIETPSGDYYWTGDGDFTVSNGATRTRILIRHFRSHLNVNDNQSGFDVNVDHVGASYADGNTNYQVNRLDNTIDAELDAPFNPTGQYFFSSWSGCDHTHSLSSPSPQPATNRRCHATVGAGNTQTVTVNYTNNSRITVNSTPPTGVNISLSNTCRIVMSGSCSGSTGTTNWSMRDPGGMSLTMTAPATAPGNYAFSSWSGPCASRTGRSCEVSTPAGSHHTFTANYVQIPDSTLSIALAGGPSSGTFSSTAAAGNCGTSIAVTGTRNCTQAAGTVPTSGTLSLTAPTIAGYSFANWSGDFCNGSTANPCTGIGVPSGQLRSITANYSPANMSLTIQSRPSVPLPGFSSSCNGQNGACTASGSRGTTDWNESATGTLSANLTAPDRVPAGGSVDYFFDYWLSADSGWLGNNRTIAVSLNGANPSDTVTAMYRPIQHRVDLFQAVESGSSSMSNGTVIVTTSGGPDNHCPSPSGCALNNTTPVTRGPQDSRIQTTYSVPSTATDPSTGGQYQFVGWEITSSQSGSLCGIYNCSSTSVSFQSPSASTRATETTTFRAVYRISAYILNVRAEVEGGSTIAVPFDVNEVEPDLTCSGSATHRGTTPYTARDEINPIVGSVGATCPSGYVTWTAPEEFESATAIYGFKQWNITVCGSNDIPAVDPANPRTVRARITQKDCENTITAVYQFKQFRIIEGR